MQCIARQQAGQYKTDTVCFHGSDWSLARRKRTVLGEHYYGIGRPSLRLSVV